jgi:hypothetical protein
MSIFKVLVDAAVHFEHELPIRCDIGAKTVGRFGAALNKTSSQFLNTTP